jgi:hypothetical protein
MPVLTEASLKAQRRELENQLRTLTDERNKLSLASLSGDANAITAIEAIDRDRQRLASAVETLNAALRELASKPRLRKLTELGDVERLKAHLRYEVSNRRENLVFNIERRQHESTSGHARREMVAYCDPFTVAREAITPSVRREVAYWDSHADAHGQEAARRQQQKLDAAREQEISRLAAELVEATKLPALPDAITRFMEGR